MGENTQRLLYGTVVALFAAGLAWATAAAPPARASSPPKALHENAGPGTGDPAVPPSLRRAIQRTLNQDWSQQAELTASDGVGQGSFGISVALSADGTEALVGADDHGNYTYVGAAYVFTRSRSGGTWSQTAELLPADMQQFDGFGEAVALSADGKTAVVGAPGYTIDGNPAAGAAYVFNESNGTWSQTTRFLNRDRYSSNEGFGTSVAVSGDGLTAIVGSDYGNVTYGAAYVFKNNNGTWSRQAKLTASDGEQGDEFGFKTALSADGTVALVSADGRDSYSGVAYVFDESDGGWTQTAELAPSDGGGFEFQFGYSVALSGSGTIALVGELCWPDYTYCYGRAYFFTDTGGAWSQTAVLHDPDGLELNDGFGFGVALSADGATALVAGVDFSPGGTAHVLRASGQTWSQTAELTASDEAAPGHAFGASMALSTGGTTALAGAASSSSQSYAGVAYVFTQPVARVGFRPSSGPPGSITRVRGGGFSPGETVDLSIGRLADKVQANANGHFTVTLRLPGRAKPGSYTLTAEGETSGLSAQAVFTVTPTSSGSMPSGP
jgi:hypothetical protein